MITEINLFWLWSMSIKTIDSQIEAVLSENSNGLVYVGASWCAPCKAMRPLLWLEADKNPTIKLTELDLSAYSEGFESVYVRSLPAFLQMKNGQIVRALSGMLTAKQMKSLFSDIGVLEDNNAEQALLAMEHALQNGRIYEAIEYYQQLSPELKYIPVLQKMKSRCDLIAGAVSLLQQQETKPMILKDMLLAFSKGEVEAGLSAINANDLDDATLREWYVHGINCLEDSDVAAGFRRKLVS